MPSRSKTPRLGVMGDFNRRIDEEAAANIAKDQVRSDGSDARARTRSAPMAKSPPSICGRNFPTANPRCIKMPLHGREWLHGFQGLDHIVISDALKAINPPTLTSRKVPVDNAPGQPIETSDHCPRVVKLAF